MMLYKPMVSLIVAITTASSTAASATPVRRGGTPSVSQCNTGSSAQCCESYTSSINSEVSAMAMLLGLSPNIPGGFGLNCLTIAGGSCNDNEVCCAKFKQNGIVNLAFDCDNTL